MIYLLLELILIDAGILFNVFGIFNFSLNSLILAQRLLISACLDLPSNPILLAISA